MRNRLVCIVNNYNYSRYLPQCLDSALNQSFDRIIVVDDGSSDDSAAIIESYASKNSRLIPIVKPNGGQLSCFNAAAKYVEEGDLVFFLDADDLYPENYASEVVKLISKERADAYFCRAVQFVDEQDCLVDARIAEDSPIIVPLSSAVTLATNLWSGSPTSAVVMTGALFHQIIPYPFVNDWRVRADDVLVFGASILGAKKMHIRSLGIGYRQHGNNLFAGNKVWDTPQERALRKFRIERLFRILSERAGVQRYPGYSALNVELQLMDDEVKEFLRIEPKKLIRRALRKKIKNMFLGGLA